MIMRHTVSALAFSAALLAACEPGEPDPAPAPPVKPEAGIGTGENSAPDPADVMSSNSGTDAPEEDMSNYASGTRIDVEAALASPAASGEWVTKPNWTGFGPPDSEAAFMVRCTEFDMIELTRAIEIDPARPVPAIIAAGDRTERGYWKADEDAEIPAARLEIYAASPVFDAMSGADTIGILAEGQPALIVPGDPQLDQQVKACRNDSPGTP